MGEENEKCVEKGLSHSFKVKIQLRKFTCGPYRDKQQNVLAHLTSLLLSY